MNEKKNQPVAPADKSRDEELISLIRQAQEGSQEAYFRLLGKYRPLLEASVSRFCAQDMSLQDHEDMREEAERVFLNALSTFDIDREGVDFGLYAKICLKNGLISEWRSLTARRRRGIVSLTEESCSEGEDPAVRLVEEERFRSLYRLIRDHLSAFENQVWWLYVSGTEVREIAERLGREEKSVHNAIYRIRRKLRALLSEQGSGD